MRYNPETERGITLEQISHSCWRAVENLQPRPILVPDRIWDCTNGGWITPGQALAIVNN